MRMNMQLPIVAGHMLWRWRYANAADPLEALTQSSTVFVTVYGEMMSCAVRDLRKGLESQASPSIENQMYDRMKTTMLWGQRRLGRSHDVFQMYHFSGKSDLCDSWTRDEKGI